MFAIREEGTKVTDKNFMDAIHKINAERRNPVNIPRDEFV
jgi:ATP-dependent 26S proteasome regulatory subunit